jgi:signal transduction histidine kinase
MPRRRDAADAPAGGAARAERHRWAVQLAAAVIGSAIVLSRISLQPALGASSPFILAWPATMLAAFFGGFWPAALVGVVGLGVGQWALRTGGLPPLGPGGQVIYLAFGLIFAAAGGMRLAALRRARADAERISQMHGQLLSVARLNAIGVLAGSLAHELNQPLTAIAAYMGALKRLTATEPPTPARIYDLAEKTMAQALRAREVVASARARIGGEMRFETSSLSRLVSDTVAVALVDRRPDSIAVDIELDDAHDCVLADRVQVQQVLLNLVRNAAEALDGHPRPRLGVTSQPRGDGRVEVLVSDNGPGVAPEIAERLFQPFATGKPDGMGLGLAISRGIVEAHGGELVLAPSPGGGATFRFSLAAAEAQAA